jgi:uncharacterized protein (DUF927 family)
MSSVAGFPTKADTEIKKKIKYFFATYSQSKFQRIVNGKTFDAILNERAGFVETRADVNGSIEDVFYVFPEYFKNTIAKGLPLKIVCKLLVDLKIMEITQASDTPSTVVRIDGKLCRMYVISSRIFE